MYLLLYLLYNIKKNWFFILILVLITNLLCAKTKKFEIHKILIEFIFIEYILIILSITGLYSLEWINILKYISSGYYMSPNLIPIVNINIKYFFMNILMFFPFGILVPCVFKFKLGNINILLLYLLHFHY